MTPQSEQLAPVAIAPVDPSAQPIQPLSTDSQLSTLNPQQASVVPSPQTQVAAAPAALRQRSRNGKIARLQKHYRDMVNRMLQNNISYDRIVGALDECGIQVTERNISNWKTRGGYQEWCIAEDHALTLRLHQDNIASFLRKDNATDVPEVGLQLAATRLAEFFLTPQAAQLLASDPEEYHRRAADLARLTAEIHKLQKYRDDSTRRVNWKEDPERVRRETEKDLETIRGTYSSTAPDNANIDTPAIPHRNFISNAA